MRPGRADQLSGPPGQPSQPRLNSRYDSGGCQASAGPHPPHLAGLGDHCALGGGVGLGGGAEAEAELGAEGEAGAVVEWLREADQLRRRAAGDAEAVVASDVERPWVACVAVGSPSAVADGGARSGCRSAPARGRHCRRWRRPSGGHGEGQALAAGVAEAEGEAEAALLVAGHGVDGEHAALRVDAQQPGLGAQAAGEFEAGAGLSGAAVAPHVGLSERGEREPAEPDLLGQVGAEAHLVHGRGLAVEGLGAGIGGEFGPARVGAQAEFEAAARGEPPAQFDEAEAQAESAGFGATRVAHVVRVAPAGARGGPQRGRAARPLQVGVYRDEPGLERAVRSARAPVAGAAAAGHGEAEHPVVAEPRVHADVAGLQLAVVVARAGRGALERLDVALSPELEAQAATAAAGLLAAAEGELELGAAQRIAPALEAGDEIAEAEEIAEARAVTGAARSRPWRRQRPSGRP